MPKISVILTSFNHEKFVGEAIESVLNQSFSDYELIIWDDASSDRSWEVIKSFKDPRIKPYRNDQRRRGIFGINTAIQRVSSGDYIAIHHSDDVWETTKLAAQFRFLENHRDIGAVFTNAAAIGEDGRALDDPRHAYTKIFDQENRAKEDWLNHFFYRTNVLCHPSVLVRKSCYEVCGAYRFGLAQLTDFDMWIRLCLRYDIHILPEKLVRFRVLNDERNASGRRPEAQIRHYLELHLLMRNFLQINSFDQMVKIFPEAQTYYRTESFEPAFILAMMALEDRAPPKTKLFGLELLFDLLQEPDKARRIKTLYGYDYMDFVETTEKHDVFGRYYKSTVRQGGLAS